MNENVKIKNEVGVLMFSNAVKEFKESMDANQAIEVLTGILCDSVDCTLRSWLDAGSPISKEAVSHINNAIFSVMRVAVLVVAACEYHTVKD